MAKAKAKPEAEEFALTSVADRIKSRVANLDKTTDAPASKKVSLKGKKFSLPTGESSDGPLNCIILDYVNFNAFYASDYDPNNPAPPDCFAIGREIDDMAPGTAVEKPVSAECKTCENNEFGSSGRGKACKNQVLLAIIPEDYTPDSEVFTVNVAPKGLKRWASYVRTLGSQGLDPLQVVTSISFVAEMDFPSLAFKALDKHNHDDDMGQFLPAADTILSGV